MLRGRGRARPCGYSLRRPQGLGSAGSLRLLPRHTEEPLRGPCGSRCESPRGGRPGSKGIPVARGFGGMSLNSHSALVGNPGCPRVWGSKAVPRSVSPHSIFRAPALSAACRSLAGNLRCGGSACATGRKPTLIRIVPARPAKSKVLHRVRGKRNSRHHSRTARLEVRYTVH